MSQYPPGTFQFADCIMDMHVDSARREVQARRLGRLAGAARPRGRRWSPTILAARMAAGLGRRLVAWGASLQEIYSTK